MARQDYAEAYARRDFQKLLGRDPTDIELAQVTPIYMGSDKNIHNLEGGMSAVAAIAQAEKNDPTKLAEKRKQELAGKAPEFYGNVDELFQSNLGRAASSAERDHFANLFAEGSLDAYSLGQFLQQLPENVRKQDESFRQEAGKELQAGDERYLQESVLPSVQADFARRGRSVDSSGYGAQIAQAATQQNRQRESFLSNLSAQQYAGRQGAARNDYETALNRYYQGQDYNRSRGDQVADQGTSRLYEIQNYQIQQKAYEEYLKRYGKKSNQGAGQLIGGLVGAGVGALGAGMATGGLGAGQGAGLGYQIGSGLGGSGQGMWG